MYGVRAIRTWTQADQYPALYGPNGAYRNTHHDVGDKALFNKGDYLSNHRDSDGSLAFARLWATPKKVVLTFKQTYYEWSPHFEIVPIEIIVPDDSVETMPIIL